MTKDFLKEVLGEDKQLLKKQEVNYIHVPQYDEISVKALWPEVKKDADFMLYFPSKYPKDKGPPREYFFNILNTKMPDYLKQILDHANKLRMTAAGEGQETEAIKISQYWEEQLKAMPYLSSKYSQTYSLIYSVYHSLTYSLYDSVNNFPTYSLTSSLYDLRQHSERHSRKHSDRH